MQRNAQRITEADGYRYTKVDCDCGREAYGDGWTVSCNACGREYNGSGSLLRSDWRGNPSLYDDDISDPDGYEIQHADDE